MHLNLLLVVLEVGLDLLLVVAQLLDLVPHHADVGLVHRRARLKLGVAEAVDLVREVVLILLTPAASKQATRQHKTCPLKENVSAYRDKTQVRSRCARKVCFLKGIYVDVENMGLRTQFEEVRTVGKKERTRCRLPARLPLKQSKTSTEDRAKQ